MVLSRLGVLQLNLPPVRGGGVGSGEASPDRGWGGLAGGRTPLERAVREGAAVGLMELGRRREATPLGQEYLASGLQVDRGV